MRSYPLRRHTEVIRDLVDIANADILDIGCGKGSLLGWLRKHGAKAHGIEPEQMVRDQAVAELGDGAVIDASADSLPVASASQDVIIFFNSLHHVRTDRLGAALQEAHRVLRPQGAVLVIEPLAEGAYFELLRPVDDETTIRAAALAALDDAESAGFAREHRSFYRTIVVQPSAQALKASFLAANPARAAMIETWSHRLDELFDELGKLDAESGSKQFDQPFRVDLLRKAGSCP